MENANKNVHWKKRKKKEVIGKLSPILEKLKDLFRLL